MRDLEAWISQLPELAGHGGPRAVPRVLEQGVGNLGVIHDSGWESPNAYPCNYYGMDTGDCVPAHSAVVYLVTGVAGMALLLALTVFFICCLCYRKRRREQAEATFLRWHEAQAVRYPMVAAYPGGNPHAAVEVPMGPVAEGKNPSVCVIMAGEEKPTFLAHPVGGGSDLPTSEGPKEAEEAAHRGSKSAG